MGAEVFCAWEVPRLTDYFCFTSSSSSSSSSGGAGITGEKKEKEEAGIRNQNDYHQGKEALWRTSAYKGKHISPPVASGFESLSFQREKGEGGTLIRPVPFFLSL